MRYWKKVQKFYVETSRVVCDSCEKEISKDETQVSIYSANYHDDEDIVCSLDCCIRCFENKVKPALETALGTVFKDYTCSEYYGDTRGEPDPK